MPYKPIGNKAWSMAVKRRFQPLMRQLLIDSWHSRHIVTLGREAFLWFAIGQPREARQRLEAFWQREDRFTANLDIDLQDAQGHARTFTLHPLPHLTAEPDLVQTLPALLEARLRQLDASR